MNTTSALFLIIGMGVVTYIPRMLPFLLFKNKELPPFIQEVLKNIPYATLGALIFPGILLIKEGDFTFGLLGAIGAFILAFLGTNVIFVVIGAILIVTSYSHFFT